MKFFSDNSVPYVNADQQHKQKLLIGAIIVMAILGIVLYLVTFVFGDDEFALKINEAVESQERTKLVAEQVEEYAGGSGAANFSSTVISVTTSNVIQLRNYRSARLGDIVGSEPDISEEKQSLEAARVSGSVNDVSVELMSANLQEALEDVTELQDLTTNQEFKQELDQIRRDTAGLLAELEDEDF